MKRRRGRSQVGVAEARRRLGVLYVLDDEPVGMAKARLIAGGHGGDRLEHDRRDETDASSSPRSGKGK